MADVQLKIPKPIDVLNTDIELQISSATNGKLGKLKLSRGGVEWWPAGNSAYGHPCSWEQLAGLFTDNVPEVRLKREPSQRKTSAKRAAKKAAA